MIERYSTVEYGALDGVAISDEQARMFNRSPALTVTPSNAVPGTWDLKASNYVGLVEADGVEILIESKVTVSRLIFMIAYSMRPDGWRELASTMEGASDPISGITHAFCHFSEKAVAQGLLQGYVVREEALHGLRGRLREAEQLRRRPGLVLPLEVVYDDYTTDIIENRLLRTAARHLLATRHITEKLRLRLRRLNALLVDVTPLTQGQRLPPVSVTRINRRYEDAVALAKLILEATAIEPTAQVLPGTSFLFDMNKIFEGFVSVALLEFNRRSVPHLELQRVSYLDAEDTVTLKPDLTWVAATHPVAVADLKYKSTEVKGLPNADVYQMLAYLVALGLPKGHLIYAAGNEEAGRRVVRHTGHEIATWALNLDAAPNDLLAAIKGLGREIAQRQHSAPTAV